MSKILIVEDEESIQRVLQKIIAKEFPKYQIHSAQDGLAAVDLLKEHPDIKVVLCDIKMPKMDGVEVLSAAQKIEHEATFIMISGHGDLDLAVETMRLGAYDYISKPPDLNRLLTAVRNALDRNTIVKENKRLKRKVAKGFEMIGSSAALDEIKQKIQKVAPTEARVLITGPNGSGKELVAHQIHQQSSRSKGPMIEVNCAAIPSELIESELFGHVKGAFTSAVKDRSGKFLQAQGGTLFLDEIGDMSLSAQAKVLRALQEKKITPVGSNKSIDVDVRVLAATNKDLKAEIQEKKFREDLYHRLGVILIHVPGLNQRLEDIPLLVAHFNQLISAEYGNKPKIFEKEALMQLQQYDWSGNIRELRNVVERLIIMVESTVGKQEVIEFASK